MKAILAYAKIQSEKGRDIAGLKIELQMYVNNSGRWVEIAEAVTNAKGDWRINYTKADNLADAPALRIVEAGVLDSRVLSAGGMYSYSKTKQKLRVDFGVITHLTEAYPMTASHSLFRRTKHLVVGMYKRQQATRAVIAKALLDARTGGLKIGNIRDEGLAGNATEIDASLIAAVEEGDFDPYKTYEKTAADADGKPVAGAERDLAFEIGMLRGRKQVDEINVEFLKLKARELELETQLNQKTVQESQSAEKIKIADERIATLETDLQTKIQEKDILRAENESLQNSASRKTNIQDIAFNIGAQVDEANKKMAIQSRPYRLGKVDLNLKGVISDDGQAMTLANASDLEKTNAENVLAGVQFELIPDNSSAVDTSVKVPDIVGLTETAVRRLLTAVGLRIETANKSVGENATVPIGQCIQQSPKSNSTTSRGSTVIVVFSAL